MNNLEPSENSDKFSCPHCNVFSLMETHIKNFPSGYFDENGAPHYNNLSYTSVAIKTCLACQQVTVFVKKIINSQPDKSESQLIYPIGTNVSMELIKDNTIPKEFKIMYEDACMLSLISPKSSLMNLRVAFEFMTDAKRDKLTKGIQSTLELDRMTGKNHELVNQIKSILNASSHSNEIFSKKYDWPKITQSLLYALIVYFKKEKDLQEIFDIEKSDEDVPF